MVVKAMRVSVSAYHTYIVQSQAGTTAKTFLPSKAVWHMQRVWALEFNNLGFEFQITPLFSVNLGP